MTRNVSGSILCRELGKEEIFLDCLGKAEQKALAYLHADTSVYEITLLP